MNKKEYQAFEKAFHDFMEQEGIENLSQGHPKCPECEVEWNDNDHCPSCGESRESFDEPCFSWRMCDCCKTNLGGNRVHATGYNRKEDCIQEYSVCEDCIYYSEYGKLDDMTMMNIEDEE